MFRAIVLPIIRSIRLYNAACGKKHPIGCRPVVWPRQTTGRQPIGCFLPQAALYSLMLLMMGKTIARNMSS